LGELWLANNAQVLRYFRGRGAVNAEDLAQQVWLDVARGLATFEGDLDHFRRWLFTIAYRRLADEWRQPRHRHETATDDVPAAPVHDAVPTDGLDWAVATIRRLPPALADAVLLRVVADLDVGEIAEILGISAGTVRVRVHRGLLRLRELLDPSEKDVTPAATSTMKGVS
jgi:RNA polymerase sigma-70 factor (ECF subfamily)